MNKQEYQDFIQRCYYYYACNGDNSDANFLMELYFKRKLAVCTGDVAMLREVKAAEKDLKERQAY